MIIIKDVAHYINKLMLIVRKKFIKVFDITDIEQDDE